MDNYIEQYHNTILLKTMQRGLLRLYKLMSTKQHAPVISDNFDNKYSILYTTHG